MPTPEVGILGKCRKGESMTQFTEAFYPVYNRTRAVLQDVKAGWKRLRELHEDEDHTPQLETLFMLHERYEVFSERLVQLENLWGVYCVQYTADAKTEADRTWVEAECLKELNIIMELENGTA